MPLPDRPRQVLRHPLAFLGQVVAGFRANQGVLLAGAVAYYTLLSVVPMAALLMVGLSQVVEPDLLLEVIGAYVRALAPVHGDALVVQIALFISNWKVVGTVGLLVLLFFSSLAFTVLENAMSVIFFHRVAIRRRHFLVSAILPYCYILLLAGGLLVVSLVTGAMHTMEAGGFDLLGHHWTVPPVPSWLIYLLGVTGEALLLASLYLVMPVGRLALSHALMGGLTAAVLWEITRHLLVWYFSTLSFVNVIYGSLATTVVVLLSLEAGALILLLGAQVIAEYERLGDRAAHQPDGLTTEPG